MEKLESLVNAAREGDAQAFNQLYEYSFPTVEKECFQMLRNSFDAEDAIQDTYLHIYQHLDSLEHPERFLGWCRTIAHNSSVNYITKRQRKAGKDEPKPPVSTDKYEGMDLLDTEDREPTPEEKAEQNMIRGYLQEAVNTIAPARSLCLAMYQQGYSYDQISANLSIPLGTVKSNIHYAKQALRKEIHRIEEKENIQIFGFTLVPVGGAVEVRVQSPQSGGFVQAETSDTLKNDVWESLSKTTFKGPTGTPIWKKVLAVAVVVLVIVGGIAFAVNRAGHANFQTRRNTTTAQGVSQARNPQGRLAPSNRNAVGTNAVRAEQGNPLTNTRPVTGRTEPEEQPPSETTREVFTNQVQNFGQAVRGQN